MLSKEEIEDNRIPKQLAKTLGIEKEDTDSLIAFKESLYEQTVKENIKLKKQVEQLESDKQKLIEKLEEDKQQNYYNGKYKGNFRKSVWKDEYAKEILSMVKGENDE